MLISATGDEDALAAQEADEVAVIEGLLPRQMDKSAVRAAAAAVIAELGATGAKDMNRVIGTLKQRYPDRMEFEEVGSLVKKARSFPGRGMASKRTGL